MILFSRVALVAAALALGVLRQSADAGVIYSTFGPGHSYELNWGWGIWGTKVGFGVETKLAVPFTPSVDAELGQIDLALSHFVRGSDGVRVSLWTKYGSFPDVKLKSWDLTTPADPFDSGTNAFVSIDNIDGIYLAAGVNYYIVVELLDPASDANISWYRNPQEGKGELYTYWGAYGWTEYPDGVLPAFEVLSADVPEPATITLMLAGAAGFVRLKGRKRAK